jgi:DNA-binding winged helix-turn-helix (wHTH) protein
VDALATPDVFLFEGFRLDRLGGGLYRRDERGVFVPIVTGSRALDVLGVLVERSGDLVSRDQIIAAVWPTTVVEDNNLNMQVAALRRVLDQGRGEGSCIQTVPEPRLSLYRGCETGQRSRTLRCRVNSAKRRQHSAAPIDRRAAVRQSKRRPRAAVFCRRDCRRSDHPICHGSRTVL